MLYVKYITTDWNEPKHYSHWWLIGVRFADFAHRFSCEEEARKRMGSNMRSLGNGYFCDQCNMTYRLVTLCLG